MLQEATGGHRRPQEATGSHQRPQKATGAHRRPQEGVATGTPRLEIAVIPLQRACTKDAWG